MQRRDAAKAAKIEAFQGIEFPYCGNSNIVVSTEIRTAPTASIYRDKKLFEVGEKRSYP